MSTLKERLSSLDAFRGLAVAFMLLVDCPGSWDVRYPPLIHAHWNGWTPADLIFPSFLFIVGVSIVFALSKRKAAGADRGQIMNRILIRSAVLFILGIIVDMFYSERFFDFANMRILGVLQRIAIVYLVSGYLFLKVRTQTLIYTGIGILLGYWVIMTRIPVPGYGMPNLAVHPDGGVTNLAAWMDKVILGPHAWIWTRPWDPEGILSTIPAIATTIMGMLTGVWLKGESEKKTKTKWMLAAGTISLGTGYLWHIWFPVNKSIWTSSFVLLSGGWALIFFALLYWIIDVRGWQRWAMPFRVYGMNAITAYVCCAFVEGILSKVRITAGSESVTIKHFLFTRCLASWLSPVNGSLLYAVIAVLFWMTVMWCLYRRSVFIKV